MAPAYAPRWTDPRIGEYAGQELLNEKVLTDEIRQELTGWFGADVQQWRHLKTYHIPHALPAYNPNQAGSDPLRQPLHLAENLYQCGDQTTYPSLNAAMQTGREVAEMLIEKAAVSDKLVDDVTAL